MMKTSIIELSPASLVPSLPKLDEALPNFGTLEEAVTFITHEVQEIHKVGIFNSYAHYRVGRAFWVSVLMKYSH